MGDDIIVWGEGNREKARDKSEARNPKRIVHEGSRRSTKKNGKGCWMMEIVKFHQQPATSPHLFVSLRAPSWIILLSFWDVGFGARLAAATGIKAIKEPGTAPGSFSREVGFTRKSFGFNIHAPLGLSTKRAAAIIFFGPPQNLNP
jgi:hypothetical protein